MKHSTLTKTFWASIAILILTVIHHGYGALIYTEPFRLHVAIFIIPVLIVQTACFYTYKKRPATISGKITLWIFILITAFISIGMIGLYEGGYNHLVKNILYFGGASSSLLTQLFPPPLYEMPNDFWFELTGILQFFVGMYAGYYLFKFLSERIHAKR